MLNFVRRMRWLGYVTCIGELRNACRILIENLDGGYYSFDALERDYYLDERIISKNYFNRVRGYGLHSFGLG
jgi:hypothetical protein